MRDLAGFSTLESIRLHQLRDEVRSGQRTEWPQQGWPLWLVLGLLALPVVAVLAALAAAR